MLGIAIAIARVIRGTRAAPTVQAVVQSASAPFTSYIFGPGIVEASTENIAIGTPVSGIVTAVYVKWGDQIKSGAPLFKVDTRDLKAQLFPSSAQVKEMEAHLLTGTSTVSAQVDTLPQPHNRLSTE